MRIRRRKKMEMFTKLEWPQCIECCSKAGAKLVSYPITAWKEICKSCKKEKLTVGETDYTWPDGRKSVWD